MITIRICCPESNRAISLELDDDRFTTGLKFDVMISRDEMRQLKEQLALSLAQREFCVSRVWARQV